MFCEHCKQICVAFEELVGLISTSRLATLRLPDRKFKIRFHEMQASMKHGCEFCLFIVHCIESNSIKASSKQSSTVVLNLLFHESFEHHRRIYVDLLDVEDQEGTKYDLHVPIEVSTKDEPNHPWCPYISAHPLSEQSVKVAKRWLNDCRSTHPWCNQTSSTRLPSRVIQIKSPRGENESRVIDASKVQDLIGHYATLSHCWGNVDRTTLRKDNITMMSTGFVQSSISQQFQDAMKVAQRLEIEYIWIDCICIIQDLEEDLNHELATMGDIYANSALTIAGPACPDSETSFLKTRDAGCHFLQLQGQISNLYLRKAVKTSDTMAKNALLDARGWVFQEMNLTRRALLYGIDQMHWRCRELLDDERIERPTSGSEINNLYQGKREFLQCKLETGGKFGHVSSLMRTTNWYSLVDEYSGKELTFLPDKLRAISAIAQEIGTLTEDLYLAGLWKRDLVNGLLWGRNLIFDRSLLYPGDLDKYQRLIDSFIFLENTGTPSWSWAAYHGRVDTSRSKTFRNQDWSVEELVEIKEAGVELADPEFFTGPVKGGRIVLHGACRHILFVDEIPELRITDPIFIVRHWTKTVPLCDGTTLEINFDLATERMSKEPVLCLVLEKLIRQIWDWESEESRRHWHCLILRHAKLGDGCCRRVGVGKIEPGYKRVWNSDNEWTSELENWESELGKWRSETITIV
ncbi:HET-domain-containing protein [Pyrenochaeta sp. DS3sAY3a]|nr:HET-domain-containing protein [Pyrenochaeta sp. DS3sAY3a]